MGDPQIPSVEWVRALVNDLKNQIASIIGGTGLLASGVTTGATVQTQIFTNGVTLSNLTASKAVVSDGAKKLVSSVVSTTELALLSGKTSLMSGALSSTNLAVPLWNGITGQIIQDSGLIGTVAGSLSLPAGQTLVAPTVRGISGSDLTILSDSSGKIIMNDSGNIAAGFVGIDFSGTGGFIQLKAGAVGGISIGQAAGMGIYFPSGTQGGFASGGVLVGGWDANGFFTNTITEQVGAAGVTIAGTGGLKTNLIADNGLDMVINQTTTTKKLTLQTLDRSIVLNSGLDLDFQCVGVINHNGAPTFTGTVAAAAALNVENGLIMA